ncbi:DoxX family protein [Embleya sp. NBC_00896]|uniref:DoxX family protein n=1 Tax=Embleya sp. NBC_00896 TaxID=2975961 RepID=UPI0038652023|nr:DoxX family protein [Embleya sp. NBC_00896]
MFIAYIVVGGLLAAVLTASAVLTFTRNAQIVTEMAELGVPVGWFPGLAAAKAAGVVGLVAGLVVPALGIAAAVGLILYFIGAVVTHLRAHNHAIAVPTVICLAAVAALVLRVASA